MFSMRMVGYYYSKGTFKGVRSKVDGDLGSHFSLNTFGGVLASKSSLSPFDDMSFGKLLSSISLSIVVS